MSEGEVERSKHVFQIGSASVGPSGFWSPAATSPWPTYMPAPYERIPHECACGTATRKEKIVTESRKVRGTKWIIMDKTRDALVCDACGIVAWF